MLLALLSFAQAAPSPAMVTLVKGPVTLVAGATRTPAPAAPFLLVAGQTLDVGAGGRVVLLQQGGAHTVEGPATVDPSHLPAQGSVADAVGGLLDWRTSLSSAGASRGGAVTVTRPVPDAPVLTLTEVRWSCAACGPQNVILTNLYADSAGWTGRGEGRVAYDGPPLGPGTYVVTVGTRELAVRVVAPDGADAALAAAHPDRIADPQDRAAVIAGTLLLAGFPTDALRTLEAAGLTNLVTETERLAGLHP